jgi:predicted transcriptional regulator
MMGIYNFQPRFAPFVLDGRKQHTIRALRAYPDIPGNTLHLYTGLRTPRARLLARVRCISVDRLRISTAHDVFIRRDKLSASARERLARADGFASFADMMDFWRGRLPFDGQIICWDLDRKPRVELRQLLADAVESADRKQRILAKVVAKLGERS